MKYVHNRMLGIYQIFYEEICNKILVGVVVCCSLLLLKLYNQTCKQMPAVQSNLILRVEVSDKVFYLLYYLIALGTLSLSPLEIIVLMFEKSA